MIVAHLVVKNEADRYLWDCLNSLSGYVDHIHVYDDQSTDDTVEMARRLGAEVYTRPDDVPTFLEDEALFRQAAWESMGRLPGATILCMDADEFLTGDIDGLYFEQDNIVKGFHVREIFGTDGDVPLIRTDGFWGQITAARWAPWTDRSEFPKRRMGCGSLPESLANGPVTILEDVELLHYGYLREEDRAAKHQRYSGRPGHNPKHINSIITTPTLRPRAQLAHH